MNVAAALLLGLSMQDVPPVEDPTAAPPPPPSKITLTTGEVLEATVIEEQPGSYKVQHPVLGELVLEKSSVTTVETPSLEPAPPPSPWSGTLSLAIAGYENVNSAIEIRAAGSLTRKTDDDQLTLSARYFFGVQNNTKQNNNFQATIDQQWFIKDSKWLFFATGQYEYDEFQSWENRFSGWGGVGYKFYRTEKFDLTGRLGAGVSYELGPPVRLMPEVLAGIATEYRFTERHKIEAYFTIYPDVADIGEFRFDTGLKWILEIDGVEGLAFEAGVTDQYQSQIGSGTRNDFRYYAGLRYAF